MDSEEDEEYIETLRILKEIQNEIYKIKTKPNIEYDPNLEYVLDTLRYINNPTYGREPGKSSLSNVIQLPKKVVSFNDLVYQSNFGKKKKRSRSKRFKLSKKKSKR